MVENDTIYVYIASTWPDHVREAVALALDWEEDRVRIMPLSFPPAFDSKTWTPSLYAVYASLLAVKTEKPVLLIDVYEKYVRKKHKPNSGRIYIKTALDDQGNPLACRIKIDVDCGAFPLFTEEIIGRMLTAAATHYGYKTFEAEMNIITTNTAPAIPSPGFGTGSILFALEVHASRLAELTLSSPADWKQRALPADSSPFGIEGFDITRMRNIVETIKVDSDFQRKYSAYEMLKKRLPDPEESPSPLRGIGISSAAGANGLLQSTESRLNSAVSVTLDSDSHVLIETTAACRPSRIGAIWKKVTAESLEVSPDDVEIGKCDLSVSPGGGPSIASRNVAIATLLLTKSCETIRKKRFRDPLPIHVKRTYKMLRPPEWDSEKFSGVPFISYSLGAAVVEVEIDRVTFEPEIRSVWLYADCGSILDLEASKQSLETGLYHALSWTALERVWFRRITRAVHGATVSEGYTLPDIHIRVLSSKKKVPPEGIGVLPFIVIPPAYISAVSQATGVYFDTLPLTSEQIRTALETE